MKKSAQEWLETAISRHERHMEGKEPTTGKDGQISQTLMMAEMKFSLQAMKEKKDVEASEWYVTNEKKFPGKKSGGDKMKM